MSAAVRLKWAIARYGVPIAAVAVVVGTFALGGAWHAYTNPPTEEVTDTVDEQHVDVQLETSAVVTDETELYEPGETLIDKPAYFYNGTPDLTVRVRTSTEGVERLSISQQLVVWHGADRDGDLFWETRELVAASNGTGDGETTMEATIDMRAVRDTVAETRQEVGNVGTVQTELQLSVSYETDGFEGEFDETTAVALTDRAYWLEEPLSADRTHTDTVTRQISHPPNLSRVLTLGGLGVGSFLLGIVVVVLQRRRFDVGRIESQLDRIRYDEWISRGELPTKSEKQYVSIDSLEDLVDIAIDSKKRVIYDVDYQTYGVVDADVVYYYAEGDETLEEWFGI